MLEQEVIFREHIARKYISGKGIEIGPLHQPLVVPGEANVTYIDRLRVADLRRLYPELSQQDFVEPDIIDDGEELEKISDASQDFVIANHFLEHCQDPIKAMNNFSRVLRPGGMLYMALPDKGYIFDARRPLTPLWHLRLDHISPKWSRWLHFLEWSFFVDRKKWNSFRHAANLMRINYSIHYHVWDQVEMLKLMAYLIKRRRMKIELEMMAKNGIEVIIVLKKS